MQISAHLSLYLTYFALSELFWGLPADKRTDICLYTASRCFISADVLNCGTMFTYIASLNMK